MICGYISTGMSVFRICYSHGLYHKAIGCSYKVHRFRHASVGSNDNKTASGSRPDFGGNSGGAGRNLGERCSGPGCDNSRTYVPEVYANITVWYFFVFSHVPRRYAELLLSAYLFFAGST